MGSIRIDKKDKNYPKILIDRLGNLAPSSLYVAGDIALINNSLLGLVCSIQCPGSIVIKTLDAIRELRDSGVVVVGGYHSPMERECLDILMRGVQPVILCPAKGIAGLRLGRTVREAVKDGRLLIISSFEDNVRRSTETQAILRNDLVAALSKALWVPYIAPCGKSWSTVRKVLDRKQQVFTFDDPSNKQLFEMGARDLCEYTFGTIREKQHYAKKCGGAGNKGIHIRE